MRRALRAAAVATLLPACMLAASSTATGDSFTPVALKVSLSPVARLHGPLPIAVTVTADQGVLDTRTGSLRVRAKLSRECGAEFAHTVGTVLLDARLVPQPDPGEQYRGGVKGSGKPSAYGVETVCVFLEDEGASRQFATNTDSVVNVTRKCTAAAARYDGAAAALAAARAALRHASGAAARIRLTQLIAARRVLVQADLRPARAACGNGLPL